MKNIIFVLLLATSLFGNEVFKLTIDKNINKIYPQLINALENSHLIVVSEIDILDKFKHAGLPKKFGKEFNTSELTAIKAIIACNGFYGNYISNADPEMMAICPIRITIIEKDGKTTLLFIKPSHLAKDSKALNIVLKLENKVISVLNSLK